MFLLLNKKKISGKKILHQTHKQNYMFELNFNCQLLCLCFATLFLH